MGIISTRRACCILFLALCCTLVCFAEEQQKLPSAVYVVGEVLCNTLVCVHQQLSKSSRFISGASVLVECRNNDGTGLTFRKEIQTNRHGVFRARLRRKIAEIKGCSVKLISSNEPFCSVASSATSSELRLKSKRNNGMHVFSAGFFTFKPLKQPEFCNQEPKPVTERKLVDEPASFFFPPIPFVPSPPLIPNPFQPPPSILPPILPSPPPSIFPPIFPSPPPSIFPPILPPLPFFTPPPPPPASIFPPFPFPLPPNPFFPGNPPHPHK